MSYHDLSHSLIIRDARDDKTVPFDRNDLVCVAHRVRVGSAEWVHYGTILGNTSNSIVAGLSAIRDAIIAETGLIPSIDNFFMRSLVLPNEQLVDVEFRISQQDELRKLGTSSNGIGFSVIGLLEQSQVIHLVLFAKDALEAVQSAADHAHNSLGKDFSFLEVRSSQVDEDVESRVSGISDILLKSFPGD